MVRRRLRSRLTWLLLAVVLGAGIYSVVPGGRYEYEEVLYLELDGSATLDVNASVASLVALHGADFDLGSEPDPDRVRALFAAPGVEVSAVTFFRRRGRPFVHVSLDMNDVRRLTASPPYARSAFRLERSGEAMTYRQVVRAAQADADRVEDRGTSPWTGEELAAFRMHVPSRVLFENATSDVLRGNILVWEQPLAGRLAHEPLDLHVEMERESILSSTVTLFGATIGAAALTFAVVIALVVRKGRAAVQAEDKTPGVLSG